MADLSVQSDDLTQASAVTPADRAIAPRFWNRWGTSLLRRLLGARQEEM